MLALSQSQQEILFLMGVEIWRQRDPQLPRDSLASGATGSHTNWIVTVRPELPAEVVVVCECESPAAGLDPPAQRLLENILYATAFQYQNCLQLLCGGIDDEDSSGLFQIVNESMIREEAPLLIFGSRAGALFDDAVMQEADPDLPNFLPTVLPALSTMLVEPQSKRICWNALQKVLARDS